MTMIAGTIIKVDEWLNASPADEEVLCLNSDGTGKYIPYEIVVEKLYQLCGHNWSCYNLNVTYTNLPDRRTLISGTIEVEVNYKVESEIIKRRLSGGANFICNNSKIPHTTAAVKSLAIMSTVKPLGKQFGWQLNEGEDNTNLTDFYPDVEIKPTMDMVILKKYHKAILEKDEKGINEIKAQYHVED